MASAYRILKGLSLFSALVLMACATRPQQPPAAGLLEVPFWPQQQYQCGPAALASLLNQSGVSVTPDDLTPLVFLPERQGSVPLEMLAAPRQFQRLSFVLPPSSASLEASLAEGYAPLVLLNLGLAWWPIWHYAVVIGVSADTVWLHSGLEAQKPVPRDRFENQWEAASHWAMFITTPAHLPRFLAPNVLAQGIAPLEETQPELALEAYAAATALWPASDLLAFGQANSLLRLQRWGAATSAFESLAQRHPGSPAILNNLALSLAGSGRKSEAMALLLQTLERADLGPSWRLVIGQTLQDIDRP